MTKVPDEGVGGLIEFRDSVVENTEGFGIKVQDKSAAKARVKFVNCSLRNTANNRMYADGWTPIWIRARQPAATKRARGH